MSSRNAANLTIVFGIACLAYGAAADVDTTPLVFGVVAVLSGGTWRFRA